MRSSSEIRGKCQITNFKSLQKGFSPLSGNNFSASLLLLEAFCNQSENGALSQMKGCSKGDGLIDPSLVSLLKSSMLLQVYGDKVKVLTRSSGGVSQRAAGCNSNASTQYVLQEQG